MTEDEWQKYFPRLTRLIGCELGQDFFLWGQTLVEIICKYGDESNLISVEGTLLELKTLLSMIEDGKTSAEKFMAEINEECIPQYDNMPLLQYLEDIEKLLALNVVRLKNDVSA